MKVDLNTYTVNRTEDVKVHGKFVNRELSWIDFNYRVLNCAAEGYKYEIPLNERFNFLAITESNLDEFISVRFGYVCNNKKTEPYEKIISEIIKFKENQKKIFLNSFPLNKLPNGYKFSKVKDLDKKELKDVENYYNNSLFPLLTPINISRDGVYEAIRSAQLCIGVLIRTPNDTFELNAIAMPSSISRLYYIGKNILLVDDIIQKFLKDSLFINKDIESTCIFKIIRDGDISLDHKSHKFMVERMQDTITRRNTAKPIFLEVSSDDEYIIGELCDVFEINPKRVYAGYDEPLDYKAFSKITAFSESYKPFTSVEYSNTDNYNSLLDALRDGHDILLHHPYDSFNTVVKFIEHAAIDPNVLNIRQTLYRVSSEDSPIINALCKASENGKEVVVLVEIKARFDEANNIKLIDKLRSAGVCVLTSFEYIKTHAKMCIIVRQEDDKLKIYSHLGTGNYNEKTARMYTDLSYLTSKRKIGEDLINIFNILSGNSAPDDRLQKISYAPINLRESINKRIDTEIQAAKKGKPAEIFMKLNSLSDKRMVNKLYLAANSGVKVYILCRGICSIVPRKNLFVKSIVGRFLEHSRIYYFKNSDVCISSADLLTRNLDKRVEILISLKDSNVVKQLKWIIDVLKRDRLNSFAMQPDMSYKRMDGSFNSHKWFIDHTDTMKRKKKWKNDK